MCALIVKEGALFGRAAFSADLWDEVLPERIISISEGIAPEPMLSVHTPDQTYRIRVGNRQFSEVVDYLEANTPFVIHGHWLHRYVVFVYGYRKLRVRPRAGTANESSKGRPRGDENSGETSGQGDSSGIAHKIHAGLKYRGLLVAGVWVLAACNALVLGMIAISGRMEDAATLDPVLIPLGLFGVLACCIGLRISASREEKAR